MKILTPHLILIPLSAQQMKLWLISPAKVARQLDCSYIPIPFFQKTAANKVYRAKISLMNEDPLHALFCTYFLMVRKSDHQIVGEIGFKGLSRKQEVELGYGTFPKFQNKGYMSEAVKALSDWTLEQTAVPIKTVSAKTRSKNLYSQRVLNGAGFSILYIDLDIYHWKKDASSGSHTYDIPENDSLYMY